MELIGLYLIAAGLLVVAGIAKAVRPDDTARAIATLGPARAGNLRSARTVVRVVAIAEAAIGAVALALVRPEMAALVALSYGLFASVVAYARVRGGPLSTCGCFGRPDTPATWLHVVIDVLLCGAAVAVALDAGGGEGSANHGAILTVLSHQPWAGIPLLFASAVGMWLTLLALTSLPALQDARRGARAP